MTCPRPDPRPLAIFLMGPTAAGKTDAAIALHEELGCELISVDSMMIYRQMDIGTAKPSAAELARAPHRLIDIRDPAQAYSAADFRRDALAEMAAITARGRIPLLVGGTMLYFKTLLEGNGGLPPSDPLLRETLEAEAQTRGLAALHRELAAVDPRAAARIHPNDPQRLLRALEVQRQTGRSLTEHWQAQRAKPLPWRLRQLALVPDERAALHARIEARFDAMLAAGLVEEAAALHARGDLSLAMPAIRGVGYRQLWGYLEGQYDWTTMRARAIAATRQLAKRQLTWLRSWPGLESFAVPRTDISRTLLKIVRSAST